jgi:ubiquinone/menaquinone biosynthesis C-methylase UbiE
LTLVDLLPLFLAERMHCGKLSQVIPVQDEASAAEVKCRLAMPITLRRTDLFPDDTNPLPTSGSPEQAALIEDELQLGNEAYVQSLNKISDVAGQIYPELVSNALSVLRAVGIARPLRVFDLCSGIGIMALSLVERDVSIAELTLVDVSDEMLARARTLLDKSPGRKKVAHLVTTRLDPLVDDLERFAPASFDLVTSCNAFQHFPRPRQRALFQHVHRLLVPSGVFMFASHFKPLRPDWKGSIVEEAQASLRRHNAPAAEVAHAAEHINWYHNYLNSVDVYNWLEGAGFGFFDCVFRRFIIGIFAAVK